VFFDFSGQSLTSLDFQRIFEQNPELNLRNANFSNTILNDVSIFRADFTGADFSNVQINGARFESCVFTDANFAGSKFDRVRMEKSDLKKINWNGCEINTSEFVDSDLTLGQFVSARILGHSLYGSYSCFRNSIVNQCVFERTDLNTIKFINCQLEDSIFEDSQMRDVIFEVSDLSKTEIKNVKFKGSIYRADFSKKSLVGCDFSNAHCGIDFSNADLSGVSFRNANLGSCDFRGARLDGTDFSFAKMHSVKFFKANISRAIFFQNDVTKMSFADLPLDLAKFFEGLLDEFLNSDSQVEQRKWELEHRKNHGSNLIERKNSDGEFIGYVEGVSYDEFGKAYIWDPFKDSYREYD